MGLSNCVIIYHIPTLTVLVQKHNLGYIFNCKRRASFSCFCYKSVIIKTQNNFSTLKAHNYLRKSRIGIFFIWLGLYLKSFVRAKIVDQEFRDTLLCSLSILLPGFWNFFHKIPKLQTLPSKSALLVHLARTNRFPEKYIFPLPHCRDT